ncbi:hypothetical protein BH10PSE16_BH10PSE16_00680 [soil metagenome]
MFDFTNAQLPTLSPLAASFEENEVEADCKRLLMDLFTAHLAKTVFDVNVRGAAHLGSLELVRKAVSMDGLVLLQGDREEAATRYLYRAWKSGDVQGRGLHFLRTYLQLLFPGECTIVQKWHENEPEKPYPDWLHDLTPGYSMDYWHLGDDELTLDGSWNVGSRYYHLDESMGANEINTDRLFLTSRIEITMGPSIDTASLAKISSILSNCMPARLITQFRFWRDRVLSEEPDIDQWFLGSDAGNLGDRVLTAISE